jgi:hypothetical protein
MKVIMRVGISGTRSGVEWPPIGGTLECSADEAAQLCAGGLAIPFVGDDTEKAVPEPAEERAPRARATARKSTKP